MGYLRLVGIQHTVHKVKDCMGGLVLVQEVPHGQELQVKSF